MKRFLHKIIPWALLSPSCLLLALSSMLAQSSTPLLLAKENSIADGNSFDVLAGKDYLEKHFGASLDSLGLTIEKSKFLPTVIDGSINYCYCFDFNGDKGYAVFDDEKIYQLVKEGDYPWLFNDDVYYDLEGGFLHYDQDADIFKRIDCNTGEITNDDCIIDFSEGNYDDVDGRLTAANLPSYMASVHPGWSLTNTVVITNYSKRRQFTNSFYRQCYLYEDGSSSGWCSEGNCAPNAMYSYLYNLPTAVSPIGAGYNYCVNLNNGKNVTQRRSVFTSYSDSFSYLLSDNTYAIDDDSGTPRKTSIQWELQPSYKEVWDLSDDLYWQVRTEAIRHGFDPRFGFYMRTYSEMVLETILNTYYGYDVDIFGTSVMENVFTDILFGIPVVFSTNGSKTYSNHGMAIYGYKRYEYQVIVDGVSTTKSAHIWLVDDGWDPQGSSEEKWFDPNRDSDNFYFCTDRNSLTWAGC